jgi:GNAT superfamily N-acetyltransferase
MVEHKRFSSARTVVIRSYRHEDRAAVRELFYRGRVDGKTVEDPRDTGADMDIIECAYFAQPQDHFWVAESGGKIVGIIGVAEMEPRVAEILRLRIDPAWRRTPLVNRLMRTALQHCARYHYRKVLLNTFCDHQRALRLFGADLHPHIRIRRDRGNRARIELCTETAGAAETLSEAG